jgi:uncharacterized protein YggU (UPF0235/DUF167 family)
MKKEEVRLVVIVQPNRELINYLSEILGVAKSRISVGKGLKAKKKLVSISGLSPGQLPNIISGLDIG